MRIQAENERLRSVINHMGSYINAAIVNIEAAEEVARTALSKPDDANQLSPPQEPLAITPPSLSVARAIIAVCERHEWYRLFTQEAVEIMMQASGGNMNPRQAQDAWRTLLSEVGLKEQRDA